MLDDPRSILWIGTGTKTGKTVACAQWLIEGMARGARCAWVGPWHKRTRTGFEHIASAYAEATRAGLVRVRENDMSIHLQATGGVLESFSGDNPDSIYGEAFDRVVIDEAGRQPAGVLPAALSTVTATAGKIRIAFNLDRGRKHWAVAGLLAARAGDDPTHGWMTMPTAASPYVGSGAIELARRTLPDRVFRALYLAEIQEDDALVFRGIDGCAVGSFAAPVPGRAYVIGVDLARKLDWTVCAVLDIKAASIVAFERSHGLPWGEQRRRIKDLSVRYGNARLVVDATGVGDPNVEELVRDQCSVEPFIFTGPSKRDLIEALIVAIEQRSVTFPRVEALINELEVFEYETKPSGGLSYAAPEGQHDDCVIALALAWRGGLRGRHGALTASDRMSFGSTVSNRRNIGAL